MKQRLVIALLAALCFGAGFAARMWTDDDLPAVPPPPVAAGGEFATVTPAKNDTKKKSGHPSGRSSSANRNRLAGDIQRLRPQIDTYLARREELDKEFERDLVSLLTPEQREKFAARQKRVAERNAKDAAREAAETGLLTDEQIFQLQQRPMGNLLWSLSINSRYDFLNKDLKFDSEQEPKVRELYRQRRDKFIALLDTVTPPSVTLSQLATQVQKIGGDPAKK